MKKILIISLIVISIFITSFVSAENIGKFKVGSNVNIKNYCSSGTCTYGNVSSIQYPDGTIIYPGASMTKNGVDYNYTFSDTNQIGTYYFVTCSNPDGVLICDNDDFIISSTGGAGSLTFLIIISAIAFIFFIASLFVPEEFFVYISGVCFLIGGVYLMINGIDVLNDINTRYIAIVYLGIGLLFTVGAYIYNLYSDKAEEEED